MSAGTFLQHGIISFLSSLADVLWLENEEQLKMNSLIARGGIR